MILVTGASGVLGHALAEELARDSNPFRLISSEDVDLRNSEKTVKLFSEIGPSVVFHLAGRVHGLGGNQRFPAELYIDNIRINTNVIDAAYRAGCKKFVAVSTVAAYSADAPIPVQETSIWNGPPHPAEAAYGHAKRSMLAQLEAYASQYGFVYSYAILTNIYGPYDRFDKVNGHVVPSLIAKFHEAARDGTRVKVWGTGIAERDFIMGRDAARALLLVAEKHVGPINIATGETIQIRKVVELLQSYVKIEGVEWEASKPDGQIRRGYDVSRLKALGFVPETSLVQGLIETYEWYARVYPAVRT